MPTTSDAVLNAVMKRVVEEGCLDAQYVAPRQALGLLKAKHLPKQLKQFRHLFVAGFDGPAHHGHFYGMHWNAVSKTLVVGDDHPIGKARDLTVVLSQLLQPQKVKYVSLRPAGPGTCADSVVHFLGRRLAAKSTILCSLCTGTTRVPSPVWLGKRCLESASRADFATNVVVRVTTCSPARSKN